MATVLLIDDDDSVRTILGQTLKFLGHSVIEARNGVEGLKQFAKSGADLVITDLMMPEKEGLEVLMELRRTHPDLKVIAMSGGGRQGVGDNLRMAKYLGATKVLAKPASLEEFKAAILEVLGK